MTEYIIFLENNFLNVVLHLELLYFSSQTISTYFFYPASIFIRGVAEGRIGFADEHFYGLHI